MKKSLVALLMVIASPVGAADLAAPTITSNADSYTVTFHVEKFGDIGPRFEKQVDLAKTSLGSVSMVTSLSSKRPDGGIDVTYEMAK
jgi:hypothetical protein